MQQLKEERMQRNCSDDAQPAKSRTRSVRGSRRLLAVAALTIVALSTAVLAGSASSARSADIPLLRLGGLNYFDVCGGQLTTEQLMIWSPKTGAIEPRL